MRRPEISPRFSVRDSGGSATITLVGLTLSLAGCGGLSDAGPITARAAQRALETTLDRPLVDNVINGPDTTTAQIAQSFTGGNEFEHVVAVVFHRPSGSRALTGGADTSRIAGIDSTAVIRVANVVVLYSRKPGTVDREAALRRALVGACPGCGGR